MKSYGYGILLVICIYLISLEPVNTNHIRGHAGSHAHPHNRGHQLVRSKANALKNIGGKPASVSKPAKPVSKPVSAPQAKPTRPPLLVAPPLAAPPSAIQANQSHASTNGIQLGCNIRPTCAGSINDPTHCLPGEYHVDSCWCNVYYECSYSPDGQAVVSPFVCPEGLVVNPAGLEAGSICDWPFDVTPNPCSTTNCGCPARCATPPTCPGLHTHDHDDEENCDDTDSESKEPPKKNRTQTSRGKPVVEPNNGHLCTHGDCHGTVLIPHRCDCQFFWLCGPEQVPVLKTCGPNEIFVPEPNNGGVCVPGFPSSCTRGCLTNGKLHKCLAPQLPQAPVVPPQKLPEAPKPLPRRHPLVAMFLAQNQTLPKHLEHYSKIVYKEDLNTESS